MIGKNMFLARYGHTDHIADALKSNDQDVIEKAATNLSLSNDDIDKLVNSKTTYKKAAIGSHPNLSQEHIDKLAKDESDDVRIAVSPNPKIKKEHLDHIMKNDNHWVVLAAAHNPNLSLQQAKYGHENLSNPESMFKQSFKRQVKEIHGHDV